MMPRSALVQAPLIALLLALVVLVPTTLRSIVFADTQGASHLHIDVDPTNGSGPCDPIDTTRNVLPSAALAVALCLEEADLDPVNGGVTSLTLRVDYTGAGFTATNNLGDGLTGLGGNPNWNAAGLGGIPAWDCNVLNLPAAAPKASPSPADITCATTSLSNQSIPATAYLALLTFNSAPASGTLNLSWSGSTSILGGTGGVFEGFCSGDIVCIGGTISVSGPATSTPSPTVTPSHTPTHTATHTATHTPTLTPTTTPSPTPTATRVPGACDGDVNLDGFVDGLDVVLVGRRLHAFAPDPRFATQEDIDGDAAITAQDLRIVIQDIRTGECS